MSAFRNRTRLASLIKGISWAFIIRLIVGRLILRYLISSSFVKNSAETKSKGGASSLVEGRAASSGLPFFFLFAAIVYRRDNITQKGGLTIQRERLIMYHNES